MWCQQQYSLRQRDDKASDGLAVPIAFTTIRQLRSAASQYLALDALSSHPGGAYFTPDRKLIHQDCRPTNSLAYTLMTKGMLSCIGDEDKPSMALLDRHIQYLDQELDEAYLAATSPFESVTLPWLVSPISPCDSAGYVPTRCGTLTGPMPNFFIQRMAPIGTSSHLWPPSIPSLSGD